MASTAKGKRKEERKEQTARPSPVEGPGPSPENFQPRLSPTNQKEEEKFYVLENPYQQLVFSNYGGALAEINLPLRSKVNTSSVVREIEFDREMVREHPQNALFPSHPYFTASIDANKPLAFEEHPQGKLGGYYPLIRRDLIETGRYKTIRVKPQFYALNIVSEYPEVADLVYEAKRAHSQFDYV